MELDPQDYDVVKLLTKLKKAEAQYPTDLLASRRQGYVRRVAEIGLGLGAASGLRSTMKSGAGGNAMTSIGGFFETLLVVAIVAEASAAAYIYRDQIAEVIQSYSSNTGVQEIAPPPDNASALPELNDTELPEITETPAATLTATSSATATIAPTVVVENSGAEEQAKSTPNPNGNNGNHFGQTPKPERTKDKGNNDDGGDKDKSKVR